jgi:hypothetical protein
MATSRASHLIKGPRDHSDHASKSDAQSSNTDRQRRRQQARKQQESWNGASTTAGTTKEGTHWWIASIHWIARHRLDNYEDRAPMSPWPKPKNSIGDRKALNSKHLQRDRTHVECKGRGEARKAGSGRQAKKRTRGETRRRTTPASQGTQTEPAQSGPTRP